MIGFVHIERIGSDVVLWNGKRASAGKPVVVAVENAADLMDRDPIGWKITDKAEAALVAEEIKRRSAPTETAAPVFTNAVTESKGGK